MKVSYSWLKEYIALDLPAKDLGPHLAALGFELVSVESRGPQFKGVVAAQILEIARHPNADRLSLCMVDDGSSRLSVVCGAKNIAVGQKVPLAKIGALLPGGREISRSKIRGVESQGMLCSGEELGLASQGNGGILVMDPAVELGRDVSELSPSDQTLEVDISPNRPDCLSHWGLARELGAYFRLPVNKPRPEAVASSDPMAVAIDIQSPAACELYLGRILNGIKVGPSPAWLVSKLEAIGMRPINNVVDVTNYVLMDLGQPLHAFDLDKLEGGIAVRFGKNGEAIRALDGKDYRLTPDCLLIADAKKPVAIAGIMGGEASSVGASTSRALLESARFSPPVIRKASQTLRLRSDSSYRFERGTDPKMVELASLKAAGLILKLCGGSASSLSRQGKMPNEPASITVSSERLNGLLGAALPPDAVRSALDAIAEKLEFQGETVKFTPPSHRGDLSTAWDLAEEVGRLIGYDNIPPRISPVAPKPARQLPIQSLIERCRLRLSGFGLDEAYNYDFISEKTLKAGLWPDESLSRLANPLSEDWAILRPTLLLGLLDNARGNLNRSAESIRLYEIGKVYRAGGGGVAERWQLAALILGPSGGFWRPQRAQAGDFFDMKGIVEELLSGISGVAWAEWRGAKFHSDTLFHPGASLRLNTPKGPLGVAGLLHPRAARAWDLERTPACLFELDLEALLELEAPKSQFRAYSLFPSSRLDISILVADSIPYAEIESAIRAPGIAELKEIALVDLFMGKGIPQGKKSLTLRLRFAREDRTIVDAEVKAALARILESLKGLGAELRS